MTASVEVVLLDIEGTIAPISFVHDVLFPFARERIEAFLEVNWHEPAVCDARRQIAADAGVAEFSRVDIVPHLLALMDRDAKATGLKQLQGLIWERGYADGALRSQLFDDVAPALRCWTADGIRVCIYSSGSIAAQRDLLANTTDGDLTPLIRAYFDTTTGAKRAGESYRRIAVALERAADRILFVSDVPAELDAASEAGMHVRLAVRPGNAPVGDCLYERVPSFSNLRLPTER